MKTILTAAIVALMTVSGVQAQWQPSGPIKVLIGFRAGGGADTMARMIAEDLNAEYGWTVIPENVTGGGGAVMARALKDSPADGLTFGVGVTTTFSYNLLAVRDAGYGIEDFDFLTTMAGSQMGVVAKSDRGWNNLSDVIAAAKAGEEISFGAMTQRLADAAYYIGKVNDVEFNVVSSYTGGRAVLNAITADDVDIGWVAGPQKAGVESGELLNLVNAEEEPLAVSPDAQNLRDVGVDLFFGATFIAAAPAGLPDEARKGLTDAITTVIQKSGTKSNEFITRVFNLKVKTGDEAKRHVEQELKDSEALLDATSN